MKTILKMIGYPTIALVYFIAVMVKDFLRWAPPWIYVITSIVLVIWSLFEIISTPRNLGMLYHQMERHEKWEGTRGNWNKKIIGCKIAVTIFAAICILSAVFTARILSP